MALNWYDAVVSLPRAYLGCSAFLPDWVTDPDSNTEAVAKFLAEIDKCHGDIAELRPLSIGVASIAWKGEESERGHSHYRYDTAKPVNMGGQ